MRSENNRQFSVFAKSIDWPLLVKLIFDVKCAFLVMFSFFSLSGCTQQRSTSADISSISISEPFVDMLRFDDPRFSREEQRMLAIAQTYLEKVQQERIDARYRVEQTPEGYEVSVMFVSGYLNGSPLFSPGGHCAIILRSDGSVVRYIPGE